MVENVDTGELMKSSIEGGSDRKQDAAVRASETWSQVMDRMKEEKKSMVGYVTNIKDVVYKWILFAVIFFIFGASMGIYGAAKYYDIKMNDVVILKGFIHNNTVYDVKIRP